MHWEARLRMLADLSVLIDSSADLSPSVRPYAQSPAQVLNVARGAHMVAATWLHVRTGGPSIADFTVEAFIWVMALLMDTLMIPATSTAPAMPTIQVILTDRPPRRRPAPTAHTISMVPGSLVPTAIPANGSIRLRNRTTIPINGNIHHRSRTTIPINSGIRSRSRTTLPISRHGTIDNRIEACDTRPGF